MKDIIPFTSAEPRTLEQATIISNAWSKGQFSEMFQPMPEGKNQLGVGNTIQLNLILIILVSGELPIVLIQGLEIDLDFKEIII